MGCVGVGHPAINIPQAAFSLGSSDRNVTEGDRFQLNDSLMWQRGNRRTVVGVDWEHNRGGPLDWRHEPATLTLFSPSQARQARISVPAEYRTLEDILSLPLRTVSVAVGDARLPQANGDFTRLWNTFRLYFQETWRVEPRLVMNYGLAWNLDRNLNYDLTLPQLLAPVVGEDNLGRRHKQWTNFSPLFGLSWRLPPGEKTVVRLGAARFFDFLFPFNLDAERVALGPPGLGRQSFPGSFIPNLLPGIPNVPVATPLDFTSPTQFTGANFMSILPEIRDYLLETMNSGDQFVQQIQILKTGNLVAPDFPTASAFHANVGISQQVTDVFVVSADFAYKQFSHVGIGPVDVNLYDRPEDRGGPVIPKCVDDEQRTDPHAHCSTGPINIVQPVGRASYRGLLIKAEKRLSHGFSFVGSWAFSKNTGTSDAVANGFNLEDWHENHGPLPTDFTHIFNFAGMARLPLRLELGFNFSCLSAPPFSAYLTGIDFNGDGFNGDLTINPNLGDLLPGSTVNTFNRGMNREDLTRLVNQFNQTYAGTEDARGASIPWVTLPADYALADNFHSLDLRLSRTWSFERRVQFTVIGEVFNAYNASNLYGHSGNLTNAATFGQPTARSSQVFGSGGPRAFQFGLKVGF
jgi:hypothetical protein